MLTINDLYFSDVAGKLACARSLYDSFGRELGNQPRIREGLTRIEHLAGRLQTHMADMGMFSLCSSCGGKKGGGCCSAFMANETDAVLLLLNMLLGVEVGPQRDDLFECCYLGSKGCIFRVKPFFCLNYNCHHILTNAGRDELGALEKFASAVLREQTALEKLLLERIGFR